jgi:hypothetical protein
MNRNEKSPIILRKIDDLKNQIIINNQNEKIIKFYKILLLFQMILIILFYNYYLRL